MGMYKTSTNEFSFKLKPSTIEGVGVFAVHNIAKGTKLMLKPDGYKSRKIKEKDIPKDLLAYCVRDKYGIHRRCPDEFNHMWLCWFINHSGEPNAKEDVDLMFCALRDIKAGEEITIDYKTLGKGNGENY